MGTIARVAVMGSKEITDSHTVGRVLTQTLLALCDDTLYTGDSAAYADAILVLGGAQGVERAAQEWADGEGNTSYVIYKPNFMVDGRQNDPLPGDFVVRRRQMVDNCDVLVVIHDGDKSRFEPSIRRAMKKGKTVIEEVVQ